MPFKKGESGNPAGKPKGTISKKTEIWNEIGEWFANDGLDKYKDKVMEMLDSSSDVKCLEGMKRYEALLEYFKPKLSRTEVKAEITTDEIDLSNLPQETLDKLIDENDPNEAEGGEL